VRKVAKEDLFRLPVGRTCKPPREEEIEHIGELTNARLPIGEVLLLAIKGLHLSRELEEDVTAAPDQGCGEKEGQCGRKALVRGMVG
jgi:hypothetical protein